MSLLRIAAAELRKTVTLPATIVALALAVVGQVVITLLNSMAVRAALTAGQPERIAYTSPVDAALAAAPLGTVGAVIVGVVAVSSEYTSHASDAGGGRQIGATLTATPQRMWVLAGKALTVVVLVVAATAVAVPGSLAVAHAVIGGAAPAPTPLGDLVARSAGAGLYWSLSALMALSVTVLTRSGIVPLILFIANSSLVSFSLLLSMLTPLAFYLPDLAGTRLFASETLAVVDGALDPLVGGLVMAAWAAGLLVAAGVVLTRRDA